MATKQRTRQDAEFGDLRHVVADLRQREVDVRFLGRDWRVPVYVSVSDWDEEHGLAVRFVDGEPAEVGEDILL
jgi:hypothetical protein